MELENLVGKHKLSAVWRTEDEGNCFNFMLDNIGYCVEEDPDDGYRSAMKEIRIAKIKDIQNQFSPAIDVIGEMETDSILMLYVKGDKKNPLIRVGTDYSDDYYPCFINEWNPPMRKFTDKLSRAINR